MELTIDQALEQGVSAHRNGDIENAEFFYREILELQPTHPYANHNLGQIVVSRNELNPATIPLLPGNLLTPVQIVGWLGLIRYVKRRFGQDYGLHKGE